MNKIVASRIADRLFYEQCLRLGPVGGQPMPVKPREPVVETTWVPRAVAPQDDHYQSLESVYIQAIGLVPQRSSLDFPTDWD